MEARIFSRITSRLPTSPRVFWKIDEAGHTGGFQARPREYEHRVVAFFNEALLGSASGDVSSR